MNFSSEKLMDFAKKNKTWILIIVLVLALIYMLFGETFQNSTENYKSCNCN